MWDSSFLGQFITWDNSLRGQLITGSIRFGGQIVSGSNSFAGQIVLGQSVLGSIVIVPESPFIAPRFNIIYMVALLVSSYHFLLVFSCFDNRTLLSFSDFSPKT